MKKRVLPVFMALLIAVSAAACSSAPASESSSSSPAPTPIVESSMAEEPTPSPEPAADTAEEEALISAIMESELGETAPVTITAVEEPHAIEGTDSSLYSVDFTAGDRELSAALSLDSEGNKSVTAISKADEGLHYYYYKDAAQINEMGVVTIHVYDYNTDKEIDLSAEASEVQESLQSDVSAILEELSNVTVDQDGTTGGALSLNVAIDSPYSSDPETCAEYFYYSSMQFIAEYLALDPLPYETLAFNIVIDGENMGVMTMLTAPEYGLLGTSTPIIADQELFEVFSAKYDETMMDMDTSNYM